MKFLSIYLISIYIYYSTCCHESKCRLCASHLNLRMSSEKIFAKFAKYQKPSLPENIRQLYFVYHFFSSDLSFYRNYFHLFQQLFSFAIEGAVPKRNPQQYSIISIHQLLKRTQMRRKNCLRFYVAYNHLQRRVDTSKPRSENTECSKKFSESIGIWNIVLWYCG